MGRGTFWVIATGLWVVFQSISLSTASASNNDCQHDGTTFRCVSYIANYDGDTAKFNIASVHPLIGKKIHVRIVGIDAPEMESGDVCERQMAVKAQQELAHLLSQARRIDLVGVQRDKYFRVLADIVIDGVSMRQQLVQNGLAVPYDGGTKPIVDWCKH